MRILLVSQMYPGPDDPDLGAFIAPLEQALTARGHKIDKAVLDRRAGGRLRYLGLARRAFAAARPDVVYAHFLVPAGLIGALSQRAPLVVTAHGRDVRNVGSIPGIRALTRLTVRRAAAVIAVSKYLRRELEAKIPEARGKTEVVDSGVDLERFRIEPVADGDEPSFLCLGSLTPRKNVIRLADAFHPLGRGTLTFAGEGPLRASLEGRPRVRLVGNVSHDDVPKLIAGAHVVCQPSLIEPFGQSLLEAMACGRSVVATRIGGPPEFVPAQAGLLVDPLDVEGMTHALESALRLPRPNPAAREAAERHDVRLQAERVEAILDRAARGRQA